MIYIIEYANYALEIGDVEEDVDGKSVKVLSIVKIESRGGKTFIYVLGAETKYLEYY